MFSRKGLTFMLAAVALSAGVAVASSGGSSVTADEALNKLKEGNIRFVSGKQSHAGCDLGTVKTLAGGQKPYAIILTCSDSRVSPELMFDAGLGELFVVRVAGNITDPALIGSVEYAAEHLGTPLVMVLGHEKCGAVKATVDSKGKAEGNIGAIVKAIAPALTKTKAAKKVSEKDGAQFAEAVADENITLVKSNLTKQSKILKHLVESNKLKIVAAKYHIDNGDVEIKN